MILKLPYFYGNWIEIKMLQIIVGDDLRENIFKEKNNFFLDLFVK